MLARMRPVVSRPARSQAARSPAAAPPTRGRHTPRRLLGLACVLAVLATACGGSIPEPEVQTPEGRQFIPMVPDSIDDVGLAPSVAVDGQGLPIISYFGFPAELEEGEIPISRPVGSPFLTTEDGDDAGAVLLASVTPDQIWTRGAIAQPRETPGGVPVPFEPAAEPSLASLTPADAAGTDIAIAGTDIHAVWTTDVGVSYGVGPSPFEIGAVEETPEAGAPSIVVDGAGAPIVAYTVGGRQTGGAGRGTGGGRLEADLGRHTLEQCGSGCRPATQIALSGGEPLVVVADPSSGPGDRGATARRRLELPRSWRPTRRAGHRWLPTAKSAAIAFYTADGVALATGRSRLVVVRRRRSARDGGRGRGGLRRPTAPTTSVAFDGQGTIWIAWQDADGIHLASRTGDGFEEVDLPDTSGGVNPSLAVTEDGASVYLAWYDPTEGDLRLGHVRRDQGPADRGTAAPPVSATAPGRRELRTGRTDRPRHRRAGLHVRPAVPRRRRPAEPFTLNFDNKDPFRPQHRDVATDEAAITATRSSKRSRCPGPDPGDARRPGARRRGLLLPVHAPPDHHDRGPSPWSQSGGGGGGGGG